MRTGLLFQLLLFLFSINATGQIADTTTKHKIFLLPRSEHSFDLTFRFPVGAFGDDFKPNSASSTGGLIESMEGTYGGMGAGMGYEIGLTGNYYFDKKPSNVNTGIRITYFSFSTIPFNWKTSGNYIYNDAEFSNLDFISMKAGIVFRIAIAEKKSILLYDQVCLTYGWNGGMNYDGSYMMDPYTRVSDHAEMHLHTGTGIRDEIGISLRTGHFVSALGFSFGEIKFNEATYSRDVSASGYNPLNVDENLKSSIPTSTLMLSVGVGF